MAEVKKNILTEEGLKALESELQDLKVNRRKEVAQKNRKRRENRETFPRTPSMMQQKKSERDIEARIEEIDKILKR